MIYPELVRPNHRHRGPMESRKDNNAVLDIAYTMDRVRKQFAANEEKRKSLRNTMHHAFEHVIPKEREHIVQRSISVRGGDM